MIKKPMFWIMLIWFVLVNAAQVFPSLNTVEPYVLNVPFNLAWIWGWNALITLYLIYFAVFGSKSPNVDEEVAFAYAKKTGIKGLK